MKRILILLVIITLTSCKVEPEPINYGTDTCHFCEMTIVSQAHSARAVSTKGKQFKYDAIECMVHDELKHDIEKTVRQVADFSNPGAMVPVNEAIFIINDTINSPMGANLAALQDTHTQVQDARHFTWKELISYFENENSISTGH